MAEAQARFWTRLHSLQDHSRILHLAFVEHRELVQNNKKCWGTHSLGCLRNIVDIPDISFPLPSAITVRANAQWKLDQTLTDSMNTGLSDHRDLYTHPMLYQHADHERRRTYARWFWNGGCRRSAGLPIFDATARNWLIRFRMGAHGLRVTKGAWADGGSLDRKDIICKCCRMGIVEDEMHFIFKCSLYNDMRQQFKDLFYGFSVADKQGRITLLIGDSTEDMMQSFMGHIDQIYYWEIYWQVHGTPGKHFD